MGHRSGGVQDVEGEPQAGRAKPLLIIAEQSRSGNPDVEGMKNTATQKGAIVQISLERTVARRIQAFRASNNIRQILRIGLGVW